MSTRTNILLKSGNTHKLWIYRHYDGYPAGTGAGLCRALKLLAKGYATGWDDLANKLLAERYEKQSYEKEARAIYEITTGEHGDIEWRYDITFPSTRVGEPKITVFERNWRDDDKEWAQHGPFTVKEFRTFCAKDVAATRKRVQELRRKYPKAA